LEAQDGNFHFLNRGITISGAGVEYNNRTGVMKLLIDGTDEDQGIVDGGHTYKSSSTGPQIPTGKRRNNPTSSNTSGSRFSACLHASTALP
jgi:hypothetical protein